jgi:hypothetical protein
VRLISAAEEESGSWDGGDGGSEQKVREREEARRRILQTGGLAVFGRAADDVVLLVRKECRKQRRSWRMLEQRRPIPRPSAVFHHHRICQEKYGRRSRSRPAHPHQVTVVKSNPPADRPLGSPALGVHAMHHSAAPRERPTFSCCATQSKCGRQPRFGCHVAPMRPPASAWLSRNHAMLMQCWAKQAASDDRMA